MKIRKLTLENFLSYRSMTFVYSNQGLTLVEGHDEDLGVSTGAGKSGFMDGISYAFFGTISKDMAADDIINRQAKKNMKCMLEFEDNGHSYVIHRYRKHDEHGNDLFYAVDESEPLRGKDVRETQKLIEQIIGFSFEIFSAATYFSQFSPTDRFLSASDAEKKNLIGEICDLSYYDDLLDRVKKDIGQMDAELSLLVGKKDLCSSKTSYVLEQLEQTKRKAAEWTKKKAAELAAAQQNSDNFLSDKGKRLEILKQQKILKVTAGAAFAAKAMELPRFLPEDGAAILLDVDRKLQMVAQIEEKRTTMEVDLRVKTREAFALQESIASEQRKMAAGVGSDCHHCYQPVSGPHIQKSIDVLEGKRAVLIVAIDKLKKDVEAVTQGLAVKAELLKRKTEVQSKQIEARRLELEAKAAHDAAEDHKRQVLALDGEISRLEASPNPYLAMLEKLQAESNPHDPGLVEVTLASLSAEITTLDRLLKAQVESLDNGKWWKESLSVYVRSYLMDSFLDQINEKANEYLKALFDGVLQIDIQSVTEKGKEVKEKISVTINNGGDICSYESLSGGERCRVCLAVNLAISDLACLVSRKSFNILMMDEIFNGLDEHGKNQTMKLLKELESRYDTVFVIDHTEIFKSMFTNTVSVVKRGGVSSLVA